MTGRADEHIVRLDVSVNVAHLVEGGERLDQLGDVEAGPLLRHLVSERALFRFRLRLRFRLEIRLRFRLMLRPKFVHDTE